MTTEQIPVRPVEGKAEGLRAVCFDVELNPTSKDKLPVSVIQVLPFGEVKIRDSRENFIVSDISVLSILSYFGSQSVDLAIDYDHGMYYGDNNDAAGWGEKMWAMVPPAVYNRVAPFIEVYGDRVGLIETESAEDWGVYVFTRWTEKAAEKIQAREYRYISPVVFFAFNGEANYVWNAAIVNNPAIDGMDALAASILPRERPAKESAESSAAGLTNQPTDGTAEEPISPESKPEGVRDMDLKTFAASVRPEVDVEQEDFDSEAFVTDVASELTSLREIAATHETLAAQFEQVKVERDEALEGAKAAEENIEKLNAELAEFTASNQEAAIDAAIKDGRIAASQRVWATDNFTAFESLLATLGEDQKLGPPQGESISVDEPEGDLGNEELTVASIRAYATENKLSFEKAYIELRKAGR